MHERNEQKTIHKIRVFSISTGKTLYTNSIHILIRGEKNHRTQN